MELDHLDGAVVLAADAAPGDSAGDEGLSGSGRALEDEVLAGLDGGEEALEVVEGDEEVLVEFVDRVGISCGIGGTCSLSRLDSSGLGRKAPDDEIRSVETHCLDQAPALLLEIPPGAPSCLCPKVGSYLKRCAAQALIAFHEPLDRLHAAPQAVRIAPV